MPTPFQERRKPRSFRILYMPFQVFLQRFILRREAAAAEVSTNTPSDPGLRVGGEKAPWKCGVARIDEPNEALFKAIRQYQATFKTGNGSGATEEALAFLLGHVDTHLPFEEAFLEHIKFPDLAEHRRRHQVFQHQIHSVQDRMAKGDPSAGLELSQMLYAWMREHIMKEDVVWCAFARARRKRVTNP